MKDIRVVILAGGKGTRLKPYTTVFPKPLMPIGEMPILEIILKQLKIAEFSKITLSVNHQAELIKAFFNNGSKLGLEIDYCIEDNPLGTAGPIALVKDLSDPFIVMNGDLLTTISYDRIIKYHMESGFDATIGVYPRKVNIDFGVLDLSPEGELIKYREKPTYEYMVSMGINVFNKSIVDLLIPGEKLDIPELMMRIKNSEKRVGSYKSECSWLDIGRPSDYENAIIEFEKNKTKYLNGVFV